MFDISADSPYFGDYLDELEQIGSIRQSSTFVRNLMGEGFPSPDIIGKMRARSGKMRNYIASYWVFDDHDSIEFQSEYRRGSKRNKEDAMRTIRRRKGNYIADRAEVYDIQLDKH